MTLAEIEQDVPLAARLAIPDFECRSSATFQFRRGHRRIARSTAKRSGLHIRLPSGHFFAAVFAWQGDVGGFFDAVIRATFGFRSPTRPVPVALLRAKHLAVGHLGGSAFALLSACGARRKDGASPPPRLLSIR